MNVTQISIGRFHHFNLARQLQIHGVLDCLWTGYPKYKLKDEPGVPFDKIKSFPWFQTPYMARSIFGLGNWKWLNREWAWVAHETLDKHVASNINYATIVIALSGSGLYAGASAKKHGGYHICDRGSSHIRYQNEILKEEYKRWGLEFAGIDPRNIKKEEQEYEQADRITVPSEFVKKSFIKMGVTAEKISKVAYGARLDRFQKVADPPADRFVILWVGIVSIRKGFLDILKAFQGFKHPGKQLIVIGIVTQEIKALLVSMNIDNVTFKGTVPNNELPLMYSSAHVFVFPSIEDGFGMVQGEAMACGCPVIASANTGCEDLFNDGLEGFVVPIRSPDIITQRLQQLADDSKLRTAMSEAALLKVKSLGGWDKYGDEMSALVNNIQKFA